MKHPNFLPAKGPRIPTSPRRIDHTVTMTTPVTASDIPTMGKICLSIDVDRSLGHIMRESYGDRLLVDKEQARRLAAVLLDYAGEPVITQSGITAESALVKLSEQLKSFMHNDHCNE